MLVNLTKYEFVKRWKALRYVVLCYILLQTALLIISGTFFWDDNMATIFIGDASNNPDIGTSSGLAMVLYFGMAIAIIIVPFIEGLSRFDKDLSGKQSVLEQMWPIISWKKIVSKLVTLICSTMICIGLGILSGIVFVLYSSHFEKSIVDVILNTISGIFQSPPVFILNALYLIFCFMSIYLIAFLCIAFSKSLTNKNNIAAPIGILTFVLIVAAIAFLDTLLENIPIMQLTILGTTDSLSALILSILVFFTALFGTSWLMENKVER
jgi:hypothetical protein